LLLRQSRLTFTRSDKDAVVTGSLNADPAIPLSLPVTFRSASLGTVVSATSVPGSIAGTIQVTVIVSDRGAVPVSLLVDLIPVRDTNFTIWVQ
jgi:hypothetical protein